MKLTRLTYFILIGVWLLTIGFCFFFANHSFSEISGQLNESAQDGSVTSFTREAWNFISYRAMLMGSVYMLFAISMVVLKTRILNFIELFYTGALHLKNKIRLLKKEMILAFSPLQKITILLLIFLGAYFRISLLGEAITYDEAFTYNTYASKPLHLLVSDYSYPNNHLLHTLFVKLSTGIFGLGEVSLRIPSFLFSIGSLVLGIIVTYKITRSTMAAIIALSFLTLSPVLIEYGALARGYSMLLFFTIISFGIAHYYIQKSEPSSLLLLGAIGALGLFTIPAMIYPLVLIYFWIIIASKNKKRLTIKILQSVALLGLLTLVFYTPVIIASGPESILSPDVIPDNNWKAFTSTFWDKLNALMKYYTPSLGYHTWVLILMTLFLGLVADNKKLFISFFILIPVIILQEYFAPPRVWLTLLFPLVLILSQGIQFLKTRWAQWLAVSLTISLLLINLYKMPNPQQIENRQYRYYGLKSLVHSYSDASLWSVFPQKAPLEFYCNSELNTNSPVYGTLKNNNHLIVVNSDVEQNPRNIITHYGLSEDSTYKVIYLRQMGGVKSYGEITLAKK